MNETEKKSLSAGFIQDFKFLALCVSVLAILLGCGVILDSCWNALQIKPYMELNFGGLGGEPVDRARRILWLAVVLKFGQGLLAISLGAIVIPVVKILLRIHDDCKLSVSERSEETCSDKEKRESS